MTAGEDYEPAEVLPEVDVPPDFVPAPVGLPGLDPPADWREPGPPELTLGHLLRFRDLVDRPTPPPPPVDLEALRRELERHRRTVAVHPDAAAGARRAVEGLPLVEVVAHPAVPEGKAYIVDHAAMQENLDRALDGIAARALLGCTGPMARWCPQHGVCRCPLTERRPVLGWAPCPLHAIGSAHLEVDP